MNAGFRQLDFTTRILLIVVVVVAMAFLGLFAWIASSQPVKAAPSDKDEPMTVSETSYDAYLQVKSFSYGTPSANSEGIVEKAHVQLVVESASGRDDVPETDISYAILSQDGRELGVVGGKITLSDEKTSSVLEGDIPADEASQASSVRLVASHECKIADGISSDLVAQMHQASESWQSAKETCEQAWESEQRAAEESRIKAAAAASNIPAYTGGGDYGDTLLIGDSIMVVSSWSLKDGLPGITIDAVSGRSLETGGPGEGGGSGDGVLDHVRACDRSFSRYVIGTGNNDGYGMGIDAAEEIISLLPGKQIWFVTEYVSNNLTGTANTNSTIDAMCQKYPNVHKADWHSVVVENEAAFLQGDNCHPQNRQATSAYASIVKNALDGR